MYLNDLTKLWSQSLIIGGVMCSSKGGICKGVNYITPEMIVPRRARNGSELTNMTPKRH